MPFVVGFYRNREDLKSLGGNYFLNFPNVENLSPARLLWIICSKNRKIRNQQRESILWFFPTLEKLLEIFSETNQPTKAENNRWESSKRSTKEAKSGPIGCECSDRLSALELPCLYRSPQYRLAIKCIRSLFSIIKLVGIFGRRKNWTLNRSSWFASFE